MVFIFTHGEHDHEEFDNTIYGLYQGLGLLFNIIIAIFGGFLPYFFSKCKNSQKALSHLNTFSGGILLSISLVHMLPEHVGKYLDEASGFPVSMIIFAVAIILMEWTSRYVGHSHDIEGVNNDHQKHHIHIHKHDMHNSHDDNSNDDCATTAQERKISENEVDLESGNNNACISSNISEPIQGILVPSQQQDEKKECECNNNCNNIDCICDSNCECNQSQLSSPVNAMEITVLNNNSQNHSHHHHHHHSSKKKCSSNTVALLINITVHAFFAGVSLGLGTSVGLLLAILLHKWCETCTCTIISMKNGATMKQNIISTVLLSLATPIGMIAGIILHFTVGEDDNNETLGIIQDAFNMFAAGTFVPICLGEVLHHELGKDKCDLSWKLLTFSFGFLFIIAITVIEEKL